MKVSHLTIEKSLADASKILPIIWPLKATIAINPLWDLTEKPFKEAIQFVKQFLPVKGCLAQSEYLALYQSGKLSKNSLIIALSEYLQVSKEDALLHEVIKVLMSQSVDEAVGATEKRAIFDKVKIDSIKEEILDFIITYFDESQNAWLKNGRNTSFFNTWKNQAIIQDSTWVRVLEPLPEDSARAVEAIVKSLNIEEKDLPLFFGAILSQLIGWHGFVKWLESRPNNPLVSQSATILEVVQVWCCYLYKRKDILTLGRSAGKDNCSLSQLLSPIEPDTALANYLNQITINDIPFIWQRAYELEYQHEIVNSLVVKSKDNNKYLAQFVFCIDVRSEIIRRHIESTKNYQTFSYAGFFGALFNLKNNESGNSTIQAPALVDPQMKIESIVQDHPPIQQMAKLTESVNTKLKNHLLSPFAFFEMLGSWKTISLLAKTFFSNKCQFKQHDKIQYVNAFLASENIKDTAKSIAFFLKSIGLVKNFSPVVFICGHQATTSNNPFQASFECGACGGNSGYVNADVTCQILNNANIRELLILEGIEMPKNTHFVPASHNTTTDELMIEPKAFENIEHADKIKQDIANALLALKKERALQLPEGLTYQDRHSNWAELIPEWSLANNASMIIGPREYTRDINLNGRTFLHSYDPTLDIDGAILESILTAPVVVAHWINAQYYFSATDPDIYGAGNKAIHNVVGQVGVMEGNSSDLKIGLPLQSLFYQNKRFHQPLRLLVIIFALPNLVQNILLKNPHVKALFDNGWLSLQIIAPEQNENVTR